MGVKVEHRGVTHELATNSECYRLYSEKKMKELKELMDHCDRNEKMLLERYRVKTETEQLVDHLKNYGTS